MVTVIQRFGSGLQLNIHFHTLVLDGVFSETRPGQLTFHPAPPPSDEDVAQVLATVRAPVGRLVARHQLEPADDTAPADLFTEASPILAGLVGAFVQGRVALGPRAGARVRRLGGEPDLGHAALRGPRQAQLDGFELHANVWVPPTDRARLEQLCRYLLRPPLAQHRLQRRADGCVLIQLKTVWRDGTSHLVFEPIEFLEKLAAIIARPAIHLITFRCELDAGQPALVRPAHRNPVQMHSYSLTTGQAMRDGEGAARSHSSRGCAAHAVHL
jgi:hypothetical protein